MTIYQYLGWTICGVYFLIDGVYFESGINWELGLSALRAMLNLWYIALGNKTFFKPAYLQFKDLVAVENIPFGIFLLYNYLYSRRELCLIRNN